MRPGVPKLATDSLRSPKEHVWSAVPKRHPVPTVAPDIHIFPSLSCFTSLSISRQTCNST
jgi:hypothetical protein